MPVFYHYTGLDTFYQIKKSEEQLMQPGKCMISLSKSWQDIPKKAHKGAIFGVVDPEAKGWWCYDWGPEYPLLSIVLKDMRTGDEHKNMMTLLEIEVGAGDDVHIADWGVHLHPEYNGTRNTDAEVLNNVKKAYAESLVAFSEYSAALNYKVPEVICFSAIPLERIKVVDIFDTFAFIKDQKYLYGYKEEKEFYYRKPGTFDTAALKRARQEFGLQETPYNHLSADLTL